MTKAGQGARRKQSLQAFLETDCSGLSKWGIFHAGYIAAAEEAANIAGRMIGATRREIAAEIRRELRDKQ